MATTPDQRPFCHAHRGGGVYDAAVAGEQTVVPRCSAPGCMAIATITAGGSTRIHVEGDNASEVAAVARQLAEDADARREVSRLRSPWFSGLFYLTLTVVVVALVLASGRVLALWALPVVVAASALLISIVGALQMRQDDRLSERGFVRLMGDVLRRLPLLIGRSRVEPNENGG